MSSHSLQTTREPISLTSLSYSPPLPQQHQAQPVQGSRSADLCLLPLKEKGQGPSTHATHNNTINMVAAQSELSSKQNSKYLQKLSYPCQRIWSSPRHLTRHFQQITSTSISKVIATIILIFFTPTLNQGLVTGPCVFLSKNTIARLICLHMALGCQVSPPSIELLRHSTHHSKHHSRCFRYRSSGGQKVPAVYYQTK